MPILEMTQPQPPPPNQPKVGSASKTPDKTNNCQLLRKLLYDIPLPKTAQATNCTFLLKNLLKARSLIDAIIDTNNTQPITSLEPLCTKIEALTAQVDELRKAHTQTRIPPITNDTTHTKPQQSYAAAAIAKAPTSTPTPVLTDIRSTSSDKPPTTEPHVSRPPLVNRTRQSKRIIMRFTSGHPAADERMTPLDLKYAVNEELSNARIQIIGAEYTRAGNIALTPCPPCTTDQLLNHCDTFGPAIAHGQSMDDIIFEHDRAWFNLVVGGIKLPPVRRNVELVGGQLWDEIVEWNAALRSGVKWARFLCREDDLMEKERGSLLISFETKEGYEKVLRDGVYAFGEYCKTAPYRPRHFSAQSLSLQNIRRVGGLEEKKS